MKDAEEFLRPALAIREERLSVGHPDVASTLNDLENCASKVGRMEEAEDERLRSVRNKQLGIDRARTWHLP